MKSITFSYLHTGGLTEEELHSSAHIVRDYTELLRGVSKRSDYDGKETSINLAFDSTLASEVTQLVSGLKTPNLKYIFVVGIGGSNLGSQAVYSALTGQYDSYIKRSPKIIYVDTVSATMHVGIRKIIDEDVNSKDEFIINLISKSGTTTETTANFELLYSYLTEKIGHIYDRVLVTTELNSAMWTKAQNQNFHVIDQRNVGGRFSVLSPVGQIPLLLAGLDVEAYREGARDMREKCISDNPAENIALLSAIHSYKLSKKGFIIHNDFFFNPEMELVGKWYRQLLGESIGKEKNNKGEIVQCGIFPMVSIGSVDLHSVAQLFLAGPRNVFTSFVYSAQENAEISVPEDTILPNLVEGIADKKCTDIMTAIYKGTTTSYSKRDLPYVEIALPEISEYTLGQYMQYKMIEIMYLGRFFKINPFDQPSVEEYKSETRKILHG